MTDKIIVSESEILNAILEICEPSYYGFENPNTFYDGVDAALLVVEKILDNAQVVNSEPVAFRYQYIEYGKWQYTEKFDDAELLEYIKQQYPQFKLEPLYATPHPAPDIDTLVDRFLGWKLPNDFAPDGGITFDSEYNKEYMASIGKPPMKHEPTGTNLFNASQAKAMLQYVLAGYQNEPAPDTVPRAEYVQLLELYKDAVQRLEEAESKRGS